MINVSVLKFGGTSMNDHKTWKQALDIISNYEYPVVVVSATARTTRQLIEAAKLAESGNLNEAAGIIGDIRTRHINLVSKFLKENPHQKESLIKESCERKVEEKISHLSKLLEYTYKKRELTLALQDSIAAIGEQISSYLFAQCGLATNQLTQHIDAKKIIKTNAEYGSANPNRNLINQKSGSLETILENGFTPIIGGFYGEAPDGTTTTLGFEGSDYTASLIGGALNAETIEIWTDVSGVYTGDPRFITDASPISELTYFDATEMAYFGAKVLHPSTLKPAQERNIPVFVKNMFRPEDSGTKIIRESEHQKNFLALSFKKEMSLLTVSAYETVMGYSFLTKVFGALEKYRLKVDAVNTTEASITIAIPNSEKLQNLSNELIEVGTVELENSKGLITLIGCSPSQVDELSSYIFEAFGSTKIDMLNFTEKKRNLNVVLDDSLTEEMSQRIHTSIFS
jgi:aspartate kinase